VSRHAHLDGGSELSPRFQRIIGDLPSMELCSETVSTRADKQTLVLITTLI
jgi:hypothetical protein